MSRLPAIFLVLIMNAPLAADEVLRRGLGPEPDSLDIHQAQGLAAINLLRDLREGLFTYDESGELVPGVAASWEALDEGRRYRFEMREDARWSDGSPVLAQDFLRGMQSAVTPLTAAGTAGLRTPMGNAEAV